MNKLPDFITRADIQTEGEGEYQDYIGINGTVARVSMKSTLSLQGYFSVDRESDYLMLRGHQGIGTAFLLSCTEDEMIMVQNLLETIRS